MGVVELLVLVHQDVGFVHGLAHVSPVFIVEKSESEAHVSLFLGFLAELFDALFKVRFRPV